MAMNKLKQNDDKSELLILRARHRPQSPIDSIVVGNETIIQTQCARNIGALFANTLTMEQQISPIYKSGFFQIRNVRLLKSRNTFLLNISKF
jgi:hypothetical protein